MWADEKDIIPVESENSFEVRYGEAIVQTKKFSHASVFYNLAKAQDDEECSIALFSKFEKNDLYIVLERVESYDERKRKLKAEDDTLYERPLKSFNPYPPLEVGEFDWGDESAIDKLFAEFDEQMMTEQQKLIMKEFDASFEVEETEVIQTKKKE